MDKFEQMPEASERLLLELIKKAKGHETAFMEAPYAQELLTLKEYGYVANFNCYYDMNCSFLLTGKALSYFDEKSEAEKKTRFESIKAATSFVIGPLTKVALGFITKFFPG